MTPTVRHPIFARVFDRASPQMERELGPLRDELLAGLTGHVVEVGAGTGASFGHYPATVDESASATRSRTAAPTRSS